MKPGMSFSASQLRFSRIAHHSLNKVLLIPASSPHFLFSTIQSLHKKSLFTWYSCSTGSPRALRNYCISKQSSVLICFPRGLSTNKKLTALIKNVLCKGIRLNGLLPHTGSKSGLPIAPGSSSQAAPQTSRRVKSHPPTQRYSRKNILSPSQAVGRMYLQEGCPTRMGREPDPQPCSRTALAMDPDHCRTDLPVLHIYQIVPLLSLGGHFEC